MKITSINQNFTQNIQNFTDLLPHISPQHIEDKANNEDIIINEWNINFLNNILLDLENNIQSDDNHPLSRHENSPIELYEDALKELKKALVSIPIDGTKSHGEANPNALIDLLRE